MIVNNIRKISKLFHRGEQEDAHEFLRFLVDMIQESYQKNHLQRDLKNHKNPILQIFEGKLLNTIECLKCGTISKVIDPFMDLCLELCDDLQSSIKNFFKKEVLTKENWYFCGKCQSRTKSLKEFSLKEFPDTLCIHLKRFNCIGRKLKKLIKFPSTLNLTHYLHQPTKKQVIYELYGLVEHFVPDLHYGHYISFIKGFDDTWYRYDDSNVKRIPKEKLSKVLAYILFYKRIEKISTDENPETFALKSVKENSFSCDSTNINELKSELIINQKQSPSINDFSNSNFNFNISLSKETKELINQIFTKNKLKDKSNYFSNDKHNNNSSNQDKKIEDLNLINSKSDSTNDNETKYEDSISNIPKLKRMKKENSIKNESMKIERKEHKKDTNIQSTKTNPLGKLKISRYSKLKLLFYNLLYKRKQNLFHKSIKSSYTNLHFNTWFELNKNEEFNYKNQVKSGMASELPISGRSDYDFTFDQGSKPRKRKKENIVENKGTKNIFQKLSEEKSRFETCST